MNLFTKPTGNSRGLEVIGGGRGRSTSLQIAGKVMYQCQVVPGHVRHFTLPQVPPPACCGRLMARI